MILAEPIEQSDNKKVNDNKDVKVLVVKSRKITITTVSTIFVDRKLSTALIKVTLPKNGQDVRVKKIWIQTTS